MLSKIKENYETYKKIYSELLPELDNNSDSMKIATILLENSLYLSVFTTFENFLKYMIENYIDNILKKEAKLIDLPNKFVHLIFISDKEKVTRMLDGDNKAFESHFTLLKNKLTKDLLIKHIKFKFLHKEELDKYYNKVLFKEILGDEKILYNIKLTEIEDFGEVLKTNTTNAFDFLFSYTEKIRNNIAHENDKFQIGEYSSFDKIVDAFYKIITEISKKYSDNTGYDLNIEIKNNILEN